MKAAALEQDSDDEDEDWAPGGFHPAALPRQVVLLICLTKFWCSLFNVTYYSLFWFGKLLTRYIPFIRLKEMFSSRRFRG